MKKTSCFSIYLILVTVICTLIPATAYSQYRSMKEGEKLYDQKDYSNSYREFQRADEKGISPETQYNLGNILSKQGKHEEAIAKYRSVLNYSKDDNLRSKAYYNIGNNLLQMEEYQEGENAYKNALRLNPADMDARNNYLYAKQLRELQQQQQQQGEQDEQGEDDQGDNQQQQDAQQENHPEDYGSQDEANQPDKGDKQEDTENAPEEQEIPSPRDQMNKLEADRILDMIQKNDADVQKQLRQKKGGKSPSTKEW